MLLPNQAVTVMLRPTAMDTGRTTIVAVESCLHGHLHETLERQRTNSTIGSEWHSLCSTKCSCKRLPSGGCVRVWDIFHAQGMQYIIYIYTYRCIQ